jgi:hypothetical protein
MSHKWLSYFGKSQHDWDECSDMLRWMLGGMANAAFQPSATIRFALDSAARLPTLAWLTVPSRINRAAWAELSNKLFAYRCFAEAVRIASANRCEEAGFVALLSKALLLDAFRGLWTMEGLGYYHGMVVLSNDSDPNRALTRDVISTMAAKSAIPIHTGMGLAFASDCLTSRLDGFDFAAEKCVRRFLTLCRVNSLPGFTGATIEALGMVARLLRPGSVAVLERCLQSIDDELVGRFWHGVGRAIYFSPLTIVPSASVVWPRLKQVCVEVNHETGRANVVAGFAWALTLVNLRSPEVLESLLRLDGHDLSEPDAFADGVTAAATVWNHWDSESAYLDHLCQYDPRLPHSAQVAQWNRTARSYCDGALKQRYLSLNRDGQIDALFVQGKVTPQLTTKDWHDDQ